MKSIRQLMSEYETLRLARDQLANEWEQAKAETIPPEIRKVLDEIDAKYQAMLAQIDEQLGVIEKTIRAHVITHREPVRGEWLQAVFSVRRTVKVDDVLALADKWEARYPDVATELRKIIIEKEQVSIRKARRKEETK